MEQGSATYQEQLVSALQGPLSLYQQDEMEILRVDPLSIG